MKTRLLFVVAMLGCLATSEARLSACECVGPILPCMAAEKAQAVFVGQVLEITPVDPPPKGQAPGPVVSRRVLFKITESLLGGVDDTVEVYTGSGGGDCGFSFSKGKSYLVYAHRGSTGQLTTGICARTREATRGAQGEIKELRELAQEPRKCKQSSLALVRALAGRGMIEWRASAKMTRETVASVRAGALGRILIPGARTHRSRNPAT